MNKKKLASAWVKNKLSVGCLSYNKLNFFYIMKKIILNKNKKKSSNFIWKIKIFK